MTTATPPLDLAAWEQLLGDPANADETQLNELHEQLDARARELQPKVADKTLDDAEMAELRDIIPALRTTGAQRAEWAANRDAAYGEFGSFFDEQDASTEPETEQGGEEGEQADESGSEEQGEGGEGAETGGEQATVAASAGKPGKRTSSTTAKPRVPEIGTTAAHAPKDNAARGDNHRVPVAVTAAADVYGYGAGVNMGWDNVGKAMTSKLDALRTSNQLHTGHGELVPVATLRASGVPDERKLSRHDWAANNAKMDAVANQKAITAAGGLCAPLEIDYSYQTVGATGRPVRDALPTFQAERGGIMFRPDVSPATDTDADGPKKATGVWTKENDENAYATTNPPRKAVWIVDCPDVVTAEVEALTLQLEFSNVTSRFDPETVQANQAAAMIHHDRFAENHLMAKLRAASKALTNPAATLGATRELLATLDRMAAYVRNVHRIPNGIPMRAVMPSWARQLLRADMAKAMSLGVDTLNITDSQIDSWLASRGLSPVWHLDGTDEALSSPTMARQSYALATAGSTVPDFPNDVEILMHPEGHFTFLDGGTLDLGVVRDSDLIDRNRYRQFTESWEGVAARGPEALRLVATVEDNGLSAGAADLGTATP